MQAMLKPKILPFWLLFVIAPNNRTKKQQDAATVNTNSASPPIYENCSVIAKTNRASLSSIANKHSQHDTVPRATNQSLNMLIYFNLQSTRRLLPKQKIPAKFNIISATINTTHLQYTSQGARTYPVLPIVIACITAPPGPFWSCLHQKHTTSFSDLQRLFLFEHENTVQNYQAKKLRISSRTNLR